MKYIDIEFQYQLISLPYPTRKSHKDVQFKGLDDSDLQRHKIDYQYWKGFFVPPEKQLQSATITKNMDDWNDDNLMKWYESISRVEALTKFTYEADDEMRALRGEKVYKPYTTCKHRHKLGDILWLSDTTYDVFCNKCARLLQFSECIRKYVMESNEGEVTDFIWPWYRNYFHRGDRHKYHKYIAKYDLVRLFVTQDVLPDFEKEDLEQIIRSVDQKEVMQFLKK